jgi:hypothetical protein
MDGFRMKTTTEGPINPNDIELNQDGHFIELKTTRVIDSPRLEARYIVTIINLSTQYIMTFILQLCTT